MADVKKAQSELNLSVDSGPVEEESGNGLNPELARSMQSLDGKAKRKSSAIIKNIMVGLAEAEKERKREKKRRKREEKTRRKREEEAKEVLPDEEVDGKRVPKLDGSDQNALVKERETEQKAQDARCCLLYTSDAADE